MPWNHDGAVAFNLETFIFRFQCRWDADEY